MESRINLKSKHVFPARSNTHPLRNDTKSSYNAKRLDPDELYWRLQRYKEAEERARERRRSRSGNSRISQEYHHVPRYAATDFVSTATPDFTETQNIHPLSRSAMHSSGSAVRGQRNSQNETTLLQIVDGSDTITQAALVLAERNQFQQSRALKSAAQLDRVRNINKPLQRDFEAISKTGSLLRSCGVHTADAALPSVKMRLPRVISNSRDRHDWTQNEDLENESIKHFNGLSLHKRRNIGVDGAIKDKSLQASARTTS